MTLVRWSPARELGSLQGELDRLFDGFFGASSARRDRRWVPATDLVETDGSLVLRADLPGVKEEDVDVEIKDAVLTISGERKEEQSEDTSGYYRFERVHGAFARSLTLPDGIDPDSVEASFENGVLEVRIPKPEERRPRKVAIGRKAIEGKASEKRDESES